ncbi:MAG: RHS repeat-associated core domain-containing protein [Vicinamibacterales bacterium]
MIELAPQFVDFDGDGYPDIAVMERARPDSFETGYSESQNLDNPTRTRVWIQVPGATQRWQHARQYDLPPAIWPGGDFAHVHLQHYQFGATFGSAGSCLPWESGFKTCSPNTYRADSGVRLADLNRDGLTDVVWSFGNERGALLNRGRGSPGVDASAWCASEPDDDDLVGGSCFEAAAYRPPGPLAGLEGNNSVPVTMAELGDFNGDGFVDVIDLDRLQATNDWEVWIHDPKIAAASGASAWRRDERFDAIFGCLCTIPPDASDCHAISPYGGQLVCMNTFFPRFHILDINGDGVDDLVGDTHAFIAQSRHADLLSHIDNGRGGAIVIEYTGMTQQRDDMLETAAAYPTVPWANDAGAVELWRGAAVVSSVTVTGPNLAAPGAITDYRYAHPRFDRDWRAGPGFGLVRQTRPGGAVNASSTVVEEYFHQDLGRTGRTAKRLVKDGDVLVHRYEATWALVEDPENVEGSAAGVFLARRTQEKSVNVYGNSSGAEFSRDFHYGAYGYNFIHRIEETRPTGTVAIDREPEFDVGRWIIGLVDHQLVTSSGTTLSESWFDHELGRVVWRKDLDQRRDGTEGPARYLQTQYVHDIFGNLVRQIDALGDPVYARETLFCYDGDGGVVPGCPTVSNPTQASHSVLVQIRQPYVNNGTNLVATHTFTPDPASGIPVRFSSSFADEPMIEWLLDRFSRVEFERATPTASFPSVGQPFLRAKTIYRDPVGSPSWQEEFRYADRTLIGSDQNARTVIVSDGLGGIWKTIGEGPNGFFGAAVHRDPANRRLYETYPTDCDADGLCPGLSGVPGPTISKTVTDLDALGRPVTITTPDGVSQLAYGAAGASGGLDSVITRNAKGDLTERWLDGDRVTDVFECTNTVGVGDPLSCSGSPTPTHYVYEGDSIANITDPEGNVLHYSHDTLGRVRQIADPDTGALSDPDAVGSSLTNYDPLGRVASTTNARGQINVFVYDALDRLVTSQGDGILHTVRYLDAQRQRSRLEGEVLLGGADTYSREYGYDDMGRVASQKLWVADGKTLLVDFTSDELGRTTTITYPDGSSTGSNVNSTTIVRYEYDGGYLEQVCEVYAAADPCSAASPYRYITDVFYDELGRRKTIATAVGTREYTYDTTTQRLTRDQFTGSAGSAPYSRTLDYTLYDPLGNLRTLQGSSSTNAVDFDAVYTYDRRNRLETWDPGSGALERFRYDPLGNLIGHGVASASDTNQVFGHPTHPHRITSRSDGTQYSYDLDGNRITATGPNGSEAYAFDSNNRLVCAKSSDQSTIGPCNTKDFFYDLDGTLLQGLQGTDFDDLVSWPYNNWDVTFRIWAFGEEFARKVRTGVSPRTASIWGVPGWPFEAPPGWVLALLALGAGSSLLPWAARRMAREWPPKSPQEIAASALASGLALILIIPPMPARAGGAPPSTTRRFLLNDPLGSSSAIVLDDGTAGSETVFAPFGKVHETDWVPRTGSERFAGHRRFTGSGLDLVYMKARWQDPETGVFLSVDPVVANYADPQSFNAYSYARNNPVNMNDPMGMSACALFGGICDTDPGKGGPAPDPAPGAEPIEEIIVPCHGDCDGLPWTTKQDGRIIDAVSDQYVAGEGHVVYAEFSGTGAAIENLTVYGKASQGSQGSNQITPSEINPVFGDEIGPEGEMLVRIPGSIARENPVEVIVVTSGTAAVIGEIKQTRFGEEVADPTKIADFNKLPPGMLKATAGNSIARTAYAPRDNVGDRDVQVRLHNFGPDSAQFYVYVLPTTVAQQ